MTAVLIATGQPDSWGGMPGWDVVADLTPPELINMRWLGVLRRRIAAGLVLVVVLLRAVAYVYAVRPERRSVRRAPEPRTSRQPSATRSDEATSASPGSRPPSTASAARSPTVMQNDVDVAHVIAADSRSACRTPCRSKT